MSTKHANAERIDLRSEVRPAPAPPIRLSDGSSVAVTDDMAEIRDPEGRVVVRYACGAAEIVAPAGNLTLSAPEGRVVLKSAMGIELCSGDAEEPQVLVGSSEVRVDAARLDVKTEESRVVTGRATVTAERIATAASVLTQQVERFELTATRLVEKTRDSFRDASDLAQTRAGRVRTVVKNAYALFARRTSVTSKEETSIDGSKILLG
jgi:hypothetical protein